MRVVVDLGAVKAHRYGPVWIAVVTSWPIGKHPELRFGGRVDYNTAEVEAAEGALVRFGRKDHRGINTQNDFGTVGADGTITRLAAKAARDYWLAKETTNG